MVAFSILLGVVGIIGLSFLAAGLEFTGHVIRTTATVIAVRQVTDSHLSHTQHTEFTLRFRDQDHQVITVETEQVRQARPVARGDHIQVYVPAVPADVTDVRFGRPGSYDFEMAAVFLGLAAVGLTVIAIAWVQRKRRIARVVTGLVGGP
jgi:hypothetical protein